MPPFGAIPVLGKSSKIILDVICIRKPSHQFPLFKFPIKIAFEAPVLLYPEFLKLLLRQPHRNFVAHLTGVFQDFVFIKLQKRIQFSSPVGHFHWNLPGCLILGVVEVHGDNALQFLYLLFDKVILGNPNIQNARRPARIP